MNRENPSLKKLKEIVPAPQNNINTKFILLDKSRETPKQQNNIKTCMSLVADETAAVHFQLWGHECDSFEPGDIIQLTNGIFSYSATTRNNGSSSSSNVVLRGGKRGKVEKVGEFSMLFVETPNLSEIKWGPDPFDNTKFVKLGVVSPFSRIFPSPH